MPAMISDEVSFTIRKSAGIGNIYHKHVAGIFRSRIQIWSFVEDIYSVR